MMGLRDRQGIGGKIGDEIGDDIYRLGVVLWAKFRSWTETHGLQASLDLDKKALRIDIEPKKKQQQ
jgi:hypothetical protein